MRQLPRSLRDALARGSALEPLALLAVWAERGPEHRLLAPTQLAGQGDPAAVDDAAVQVVDGALVLAPGATVAMDAASTPAGAGLTSTWQGQVTEVGRWEWAGTLGKWTRKKIYKHVRYDRTVLKDDPPIRIPFSAPATVRVSDAKLWLANNGDQNATVIVRFVDAQTSAQIGQALTVSLAAGASGVYTLTGFATLLYRGRRYILEIDFQRPNIYDFTAPNSTTRTYTISIEARGITGATAAAPWRIPVSSGGDVLLAGQEGYQPSGVAWRTFDVGEVPTGDGIITWADTVPAGTSLQVELWYTNDAALATASGTTGWTYHGVVQSGDALPPARYWRAKISMTATPAHDDTPELAGVSIIYYRDPVVIGSHVQAVPTQDGGTAIQCAPGLAGISASARSLEPVLKQQMIGRMTVQLAPEPEVDDMMSKPLRGKRAQIHIGLLGVPDTVPIHEGIIRDAAWHGQRWQLTIHDAIELASARAPNRRWPAWDAATAYQAGDIVAYQGKSWLALQANTGVTPGSDPAVWQQYGAVWKELDYTSATNASAYWHLADIAYDLLANAINLPSERIDKASIDAIKALRQGVVSQGARITRPVEVRTLLQEIAWLLEAYWTEKDGRIALIPEPDAATPPVEVIGPDDIAEGLQYRSGWAEEKNEVLILTGMTVGADAQPQDFSDGIVAFDAQAIVEADAVLSETFRDRWNVPTNELQSIATRFVQRWAGGRRRVRCSVSIRLMALEPGDVVLLRSGQLPPGTGDIKMMVLRTNLDWMKQALVLDLLEVK